MSKNYIGISRDHSISMRGIAQAASRDYNVTIEAIREQAGVAGQDTIVSVVRCGSGPGAGVIRESVNSSINVLKPLSTYTCDGGGTPLFDSVGDLIEQLENVPDANDPNTSFLVMAITDGDENHSRKWNASKLMQKIRELQKTDRWTFVFRVPRGNAKSLARNFGISEGNIQEWDQTERGFAVATQATTQAFAEYYTGLKSGVRSTNKFYTNLKDVDIKEVKANLVDISSLVNLWVTSQKETIRPYCEKMTGKAFIKGAAFYQLTKTEPEVQDYKQIVIRDKKAGTVYGGAAARQMLGLPSSGMAYVKPGDHGQYDIYIQSTSINRVLPPGTQLLYWPTHATPPVAPVAAPVAKVAAPVAPVTKTVQPQRLAPTASTTAHSADWIAGYKVGFLDGKNKTQSPRARSMEWGIGYEKGAKDGRGKQKRLYK